MKTPALLAITNLNIFDIIMLFHHVQYQRSLCNQERPILSTSIPEYLLQLQLRVGVRQDIDNQVLAFDQVQG